MSKLLIFLRTGMIAGKSSLCIPCSQHLPAGVFCHRPRHLHPLQTRPPATASLQETAGSVLRCSRCSGCAQVPMNPQEMKVGALILLVSGSRRACTAGVECAQDASSPCRLYQVSLETPLADPTGILAHHSDGLPAAEAKFKCYYDFVQ